jgi:hypothetical protein
MITEKELQRFEERKQGLDHLVAKGFKWPSAFKCGNLKRNIGDAGLEQIQKLAWLRYISGQIPDEFIAIIDGERTIIPEKREELDKYMDDQFITPCLSQDGSRYFDMCLTALQNSCYQSTIKQLEPLAEIAKKFDHTKPVKSQIKSFASKRKKELKKIIGMTNTAANRTILLELEEITEFAEYLDSQTKTSIKKLLQI